jgi:hypothetical protein
MPGSHRNHRPRARQPLHQRLRACTLVEELEPRTLLAASHLGSLLAPLSHLVSLLEPGLMRLSTPAFGASGAAHLGILKHLHEGSAGNTPTPALPISPAAQSVLSAQTVSGALSAATPGNTGLGSSLPSQAFIPTTTAPAKTTLAGPSASPAGPEALQGAFVGPIAVNPFTALPIGPSPAAPGASPSAGQTATPSPVAAGIVIFLGLPGTVGVPLPQQLLALAPTGPGPTVTTPNAATEAPTFFDTAARRLLLVVGGPDDQAPEDYLNAYEDGAVLPAPNLPRLSALDGAPTVARDSGALAWPAEALAPVAPTWPLLSEAYFREEIPTTAGVPTEVIERTSMGLGAAETPPRLETETTEARPELLGALAALGLLGAPSWRKEERDQEESRRRPTVLPLGPDR